MSEKMEIGVIGLGKFGFSLASALVELGHDVVGVDKDREHVRKAQDSLSQVYQVDATDEKALEQIGFKDLEQVIVSTGDISDETLSFLEENNLLFLKKPFRIANLLDVVKKGIKKKE